MEAEPLVIMFVRFLAVAVLVTYGASRFRMPYTIAMVIVGLGVSILRVNVGLASMDLEPELILLIFLPGLLFEASYHIDFTLFRANVWPISLMAVVGVIVSTAIIGIILNLILGLPLPESLLFGIIISATDPVAVVALFKQLGVGRRLGIVVEGESLFNDGIVIVGFVILVNIASGTADLSVSETVVNVAIAIVGGIALGLIAGLVFSEMIRRTQDPLLDIALTSILAYGVYLLAEDPLQGRVSPVIAVVVAGIVVGNYAVREAGRSSARSTMLITSFWEFIVFLINSAVFLIIGIEVQINAIVDNRGQIAIAIGAVLLARAIIVYGLRPVINLRPPGIPMTWSHVMFWGALRGAVSVALALSIPSAVESRALLIVMVFGVVLFSMIVQALTMRPLLARLGLTARSEQRLEFEEAIAKMAAAEASVGAVQTMHREHVMSRSLASHLQKRFEEAVEEFGERVAELAREEPQVAEANVAIVRQELGHHQKQAILQLRRRGIISEEVYERTCASIDEYLDHPEECDWELRANLAGDLQDLLAASQAKGAVTAPPEDLDVTEADPVPGEMWLHPGLDSDQMIPRGRPEL